MISDRARRVRRCYCWGFGAVLAATAGAGAQQSGSNTPSHQPGSQPGMNQQDQQGWQSAEYIPQLAHGTVVLFKEEGGKTTQITVQDGRVIGAEVDGQLSSPDKVQVQGNKLRVLDDNNQVVATVKIPRVSSMGMSGMNRPYNERFDPRSDRYNDRYSQQQGQTDWYSRDRSQDPRADEWRLRDQDRIGRDYDRERQDFYRQDRDNTYYQPRYDNRQGYYDPRYDNRYDSRPGYYDSRHDSRQGYYDPRYDNRQGQYDSRYDRSQDMRPNRVYGTTESGRPTLALGIRTSEATATDLSTTSTGTRYTQGIRVEQVQEGMPGAAAGLQKGDIIVAVDGRTPATMTVLQQRLAEHDSGDTVQVRVLRNGTEQTIPVKLERIDYGKYNWDFMGNATTVDQGRDTVDQDLLQPPNKQEIYRPSQESTGNSKPLWDRNRQDNPPSNPPSNPK